MAGFSQAESLPESFTQHIKQMLFSSQETFEYINYGVYCDGYLDWGQEKISEKPKNLNRIMVEVCSGTGLVNRRFIWWMY